jgi:hypothetical protein
MSCTATWCLMRFRITLLEWVNLLQTCHLESSKLCFHQLPFVAHIEGCTMHSLSTFQKLTLNVGVVSTYDIIRLDFEITPLLLVTRTTQYYTVLHGEPYAFFPLLTALCVRTLARDHCARGALTRELANVFHDFGWFAKTRFIVVPCKWRGAFHTK